MIHLHFLNKARHPQMSAISKAQKKSKPWSRKTSCPLRIFCLALAITGQKWPRNRRSTGYKDKLSATRNHSLTGCHYDTINTAKIIKNPSWHLPTIAAHPSLSAQHGNRSVTRPARTLAAQRSRSELQRSVPPWANCRNLESPWDVMWV